MEIAVYALGGLAVVVTALLLRIFAVSIEAPASATQPIELDGKPRKLGGTRYLEYRVGIRVAAPPETLWALLTDAPGFPGWNSTIISIDGTIAAGQRIRLKAKVAPDRTFPITVSEFEAPRRMVWQDGNRIFKGVRTFRLTPGADGGTDFTMAEVLTGAFLPQIAPKLPDFAPAFEAFAADLKRTAEAA